MTGGCEVDLGTIRLTPCGVIRLIVLRPGGDEIHYFRVTSLNTGCEMRFDRSGSDGGIISNLPMGRSIIRVSAIGFKDREISIDLRPGEQSELNVDLEPL